MSSRRSVLITGCSAGGMGHALALEFASKDYRVFAAVQDSSTAQDLEGTEGLEILVLDVTSVDAIRQTRDRVAEMTDGKLDILVNNAGAAYTVPTTDVEMEDVKKLFDINLFSVMAMVEEFVHLLITSGDGRVVNIGSIAAVVPAPFGAVFNASKAALHAYGDTLRLELAPFNIKVITIVSGAVASNLTRLHRGLPPDSLFLPIADAYERHISASQAEITPAASYARKVVAEVTKPKPKFWLWAGYHTTVVWLICTFLPMGSYVSWTCKTDVISPWLRVSQDWILSRIFGLKRLARIVKAEKAEKKTA